MNIKIDFIGDIHGYADKLKMLLYKLGYSDDNGYFAHPDRKVIFVGDYIDRGPDSPGVFYIVKNMVDNDQAYAIMGNHEYNAILFNLRNEKGYLRPHSIKNFKQHATTMLQFHGRQDDYDKMISWFKSLPLFIEGDGYRAMHACWDNTSIEYLNSVAAKGILSDKLIVQSSDQLSALGSAVEVVCKGLEVKLPDGVSFNDKDGTERVHIRVKWWENPKGKNFSEMSVIEGIDMEPTSFDLSMNHYSTSDVPVFFGHYWLKNSPKLLKPNVCCLDYSVAKGGYLTAYRWDGEQILRPENLIYV